MALETKLFEIRDRHTLFITMATRMEPALWDAPLNGDELACVLMAGYGVSTEQVLTTYCKISGGDGEMHSAPYKWADRTNETAHKYIHENWEHLVSGEVVDVEYILGETTEPKQSDRHWTPP